MSNRTTAKSPPSTNAAENPYLTGGNFAPMITETTAIDLRVRGSIPRELEGRLLRIGPSPIGPRQPGSLTIGSREPASCTACA